MTSTVEHCLDIGCYFAPTVLKVVTQWKVTFKSNLRE